MQFDVAFHNGINISTDSVARREFCRLSSTNDIIYVKEGSEVPRRGQVAKRDVLPDPLYNSKLVTRLINSIMLDGKKGVAQKIVYGAFDIIHEKTGKEPLEVFEKAHGEHHARAGG